MVGKKGWLRTIEVVIAVSIVALFIIAWTNHSISRRETFDFAALAFPTIQHLSLDADLRDKTLNNFGNPAKELLKEIESDAIKTLQQSEIGLRLELCSRPFMPGEQCLNTLGPLESPPEKKALGEVRSYSYSFYDSDLSNVKVLKLYLWKK